MNLLADDPARLLAACGLGVAWLALCVHSWRREGARRRRVAVEAAALAARPEAARTVLVVHASQTGAAEALAWQTARALHGAGVGMRVAALGELAPEDLARYGQALFVASTAGEGDAPDAASPFVRRHMGTTGGRLLADVEFGLLALGDRAFDRFCGFGRELHDWLLAQGARPLFERIEADRLDAQALHRWQHELGRLGSVDAGDFAASRPLQRWRLVHRRVLNPGSSGRPVYLLELAAPEGARDTAWSSGDLAQVEPPHADRPRPYSIASLPADGRLHLLVRLEQREDGSPGLASGWLTQALGPGDEVPLRLVAHMGFRLDANQARPLILIGNGTGIAGLLGHLKARAAVPGSRNWLLFGERSGLHDFHFGVEIQALRAAGVLQRLDLAFSRDQPRRVYVQHRLRAARDELREWLAAGAAVYVCGSLEGMARGVEEVLVETVGRDGVDALISAGRYRRDVY